MTQAEWAPLARAITSAFRGDFTPDDAEVYYGFLAVYDVAVVEAALHLLVQSGQVFVPSAGEIAARANQLAAHPAPSWSDAWDMLTRAMRHFGLGREREALEGLYGRHPYYGLFAQRHGWRRLYLEPVDDPSIGGAVRKRLEDEWNALVGQQQERAREGQAVAALAAGGHHGPRALDAIAALGLRRPELAAGPSEGHANVAAE